MFDLASLTKPLVTAPLALAFLDLDADRRWQLGFHDRSEPLTVRQLLSHSAGLPPWRPYTGETVAAQLRRPVAHAPLLRTASVGESTYSDLGFRLLAELLERDLDLPWRKLGLASGLTPWPWSPAPTTLPDGRDLEAWVLATDLPFPPQGPGLPHDANARAGMIGHAGFGASAAQLRNALRAWVGAGWPARMAVETARAAEGTIWGLGLIRAQRGSGRFAELLCRVPAGAGVHVIADATEAAPAPAPLLGALGEPADWWFHTGYTGGLLCVRPGDGMALAVLCHRRGPGGALLDDESLRARRWAALTRLVATIER